MNCGSAPLCGVLVIETGLAPSGTYHQDLPAVHGLWPETGSYGTSQCIAPQDSANPTKVYDCYDNDGGDLVSFETHEWTTHGVCAGVENADDFFTQMCSLADPPLSIMTDMKKAGDDLNAMSSAVATAGYEVFEVDTSNSQLYLSVCAGSNGKWKYSKVSEFSSQCGGSAGIETV